jgi:hypothetical protein
MEEIRSSETSALTTTTRRQIPENDFLHSHRRENLKSYKIKLIQQSLCRRHNMKFHRNNPIAFGKKHTDGKTVLPIMRRFNFYLDLVRPWPLFQFLDLLQSRWDSWMGDQHVARPLPAHRQHKQNKCTQTSMPEVGFESLLPVFERAKTVHALDRAAFLITCCKYCINMVITLWG